MKQKSTLLLLTSLMLTLIISCSSPKTAPYIEEQFDKTMAFGDNITAVFYLHELMAIEPDNNTIYTRLADLYSKMGNYKGALTSADIALKKANDLETKDLLFTKVRSHVGLKERAEAIAILDTLCLIDKDRAIEYKYEIATLYFEQKDLKNALVRMEEVLKNPVAGQTQKELNSDLGVDKVTYYLAALNFIGYIKIAIGDFAVADEIYAQILTVTQTFKLANNNYELLQQEKERKAKSKG